MDYLKLGHDTVFYLYIFLSTVLVLYIALGFVQSVLRFTRFAGTRTD